MDRKECTLKYGNWFSPAGIYAYPNLFNSMIHTDMDLQTQRII